MDISTCSDIWMMLKLRCWFISRLCFALLKYSSMLVRFLYSVFHSSEQRGSRFTIRSGSPSGFS